MNTVKVSIIVPVYNTEKYLDECIESIINQSLKDIEIIFIDDGSDDKSLAILNKYAKNDKRITILTQEHKKQGAARNLGMQNAKGEYIGFVDSDDWCELDMFEKLYNRAKETNSDITVCQLALYDDIKKTTDKKDKYSNLSVFSEEFFNKVFTPQETLDFVLDICVYPCNKIFKTSFLQANKIFFPENIFYEDGVFFLNAWLHAKVLTLVKGFLYNYRLKSASSTCFSNDINKLDGFKILPLKKQVLKKHGVYKQLKRNFRKFEYYSMIYWFYQIQDKKVLLKYLWKMALKRPDCLPNALYRFIVRFRLLSRLYFTKNKRILFWGASLYLENFLSKYDTSKYNIIGIIDKSTEKEGAFIHQYCCYGPDKIKELQPDEIIITIVHYAKERKKEIKEFLKQHNLKNIKVYAISNRSQKQEDKEEQQ